MALSLVLLASTLGASQMPPVGLEEKIGQLLMVGFRGTELAADAPILRDIRSRNLGGVVLYSYDVPNQSEERNIRGPRQLRRLVQQLRAAARVPPLIAIDQEGGRVRRLKEAFGFGSDTSAAGFGARDDPEATAQFAARIAKTMAGLGLNMNFAPVLDLDLNPQNPAIGRHGRSYGRDPDKVVRHASAFIAAHRVLGVSTVCKHFPGQGSAREDSHHGLPDMTTVWQRQELAPFAQLIALDHCDAVMTAHVYNGQLDRDLPATLSKKIITETLRQELGFDGVVITDDLQMHAISHTFGEARAVKLALEAGADILVFANNWQYDERVTERVLMTIKNLVARGELTAGIVDRAYQRVMRLKKKLADSQASAQHPSRSQK